MVQTRTDQAARDKVWEMIRAVQIAMMVTLDEQGRMRAHVRFFVHDTAVHDLALPLAADDEVMIVQALSGG